MMARFRAQAPATGTAEASRPDTDPELLGIDPDIDERTTSIGRADVPPPPPSTPDRAERYARLTKRKIRHTNPVVAEAAVQAAATVACMFEYTAQTTENERMSTLARFAAWAAVGDVVDLDRALHKGIVDEYIVLCAHRAPRGLRECRNVLYNAGRLLHPNDFPPARVLPAPRPLRQEAASHHQIDRLYRCVASLPGTLGTQAQVLMDLCYGVGARSADFKTLRGTAITVMRSHSRAICVVELPNNAGGFRYVPVFDKKVNARLLGLAARVGDGLVLAPTKDIAERNIANRVSERLRKRGYPGISATALRNRWILDLAERIPATLLVQLADVLDMRVLADQRGKLPRYKVRHTIAVLEEARR